MIRLPKTHNIPDYDTLAEKYAGELAIAWIQASRLKHQFGSDEAYKQWYKASAVVRYARDQGCYKKELAVTFETAVCYGPINEAISYAMTKKTWGAPVSFRRLHSEELAYIAAVSTEPRMMYILLDSNPIKQKQITRNEYKLLFGPALVNRAMRNNLSKGTDPFIRSLNHSEVSVLRHHGLGPAAFWRDVRNGNIEQARKMAQPDKRRDCTKKHYLHLNKPQTRGLNLMEDLLL